MALQTSTWDLHQPQYLAALSNFVAPNDPRAQVLINAAPSNRFKLQVSTLGLSDVVGTNGLLAASPTAWRYLAENNGHAVACEVTLSGPRITTLIEGPVVEQAIKALTALQGHNEVQAADFSVVHLRVAASRVEAYWLRSGPNGPGDRVVPFFTPPNHPLKPKPVPPPVLGGPVGTVGGPPPAPPPVGGAPPLGSPDDFLGAIKPTAQTDLNFYGGDIPRKP